MVCLRLRLVMGIDGVGILKVQNPSLRLKCRLRVAFCPMLQTQGRGRRLGKRKSVESSMWDEGDG